MGKENCMAKEFVELEEEELDVVKEYRAKRDAQKRQKNLQFEILEQAYEYEKWLRENGAGSSFSTFCDDYGYPSSENRKFIYDAVEEIRRQAWVKAA